MQPSRIINKTLLFLACATVGGVVGLLFQQFYSSPELVDPEWAEASNLGSLPQSGTRFVDWEPMTQEGLLLKLSADENLNSAEDFTSRIRASLELTSTGDLPDHLKALLEIFLIRDQPTCVKFVLSLDKQNAQKLGRILIESGRLSPSNLADTLKVFSSKERKHLTFRAISNLSCRSPTEHLEAGLNLLSNLDRAEGEKIEPYELYGLVAKQWVERDPIRAWDFSAFAFTRDRANKELYKTMASQAIEVILRSSPKLAFELAESDAIKILGFDGNFSARVKARAIRESFTIDERIASGLLSEVVANGSDVDAREARKLLSFIHPDQLLAVAAENPMLATSELLGPHLVRSLLSEGLPVSDYLKDLPTEKRNNILKNTPIFSGTSPEGLLSLLEQKELAQGLPSVFVNRITRVLANELGVNVLEEGGVSTNPEVVSSVVKSLLRQDSINLDELARKLVSTGDPKDHESSLSEVIMKWSFSGSSEAFQFIENEFVGTETELKLVSQALSTAGSPSIEARNAWEKLYLSQKVLSEDDQRALEAYAVTELRRSGSGGMEWVVTELRDDREASSIVSAAANEWARSDVYRLSEFLLTNQTFNGRDSAIEQVVLESADHPNQAVEWLGQIQDPVFREEVSERFFNLLTEAQKVNISHSLGESNSYKR